MKKLINAVESTEELLCNPCAEQTKPELDDDQKMYIVYKLNSHDSTYVPIGDTNDFDKAVALAQELSKWSTPYCNEVGRAKITQNLGFDVCHYEDGHELEMLKSNEK